MRRQTGTGGHEPVGPGRCARLDPLALPVRFTALDAAADGRVRSVEIDRERVLVRRRVRGMAIRVAMPIGNYLGVSVRLALPDVDDTVVVRLEHRDPALAVEVYEGPDDAAVIAEWQLWGRVLNLPLLMADSSGRLQDPFSRIGDVAMTAPMPRRRRRSALRRRRPTLPLRRKPGDASRVMAVHREYEIIARD